MIDTFGLAVSHGLLLLVAWRLIFRADLDDENAPKQEKRAGFSRKGRDGA